MLVVGERDEAVDSAVEILIGDWRRKGTLEPLDISRIIEKRRLTFEQMHAVLAALRAEGIVACETINSGEKKRKDSLLPLAHLLTAEEEVALANAMRLGARLEAAGEKSPEVLNLIEAGKRARDRFITSNLKLVHWVARGFRNSGLDYDDTTGKAGSDTP